VAAFAGPACPGNVRFMFENRLSKPLDPVGYISRLACMTFGAVFFSRHAECLYTGMAGAAGFGLFHFRHGDVFALAQVEDGVMAHLAVIVVFF